MGLSSTCPSCDMADEVPLFDNYERQKSQTCQVCNNQTDVLIRVEVRDVCKACADLFLKGRRLGKGSR